MVRVVCAVKNRRRAAPNPRHRHRLHIKIRADSFGNPHNAGHRMLSFLNLVDLMLQIIQWLVIASVLASWLVAFGVINMRNRGVYTIVDFLNRITEPLLRPFRRIIPSFGGMDISPMVLLLAIWFAQSLLHEYAYRAVIG